MNELFTLFSTCRSTVIDVFTTISRDVDDLLTSGPQVEKLVVLHPAIIPVEAQLVYVAYNGWIYSGRYASF